MAEFEKLGQTIGIIGIIIGFVEWRYKDLRKCLDEHVKRAEVMIERLIKLEARVKP